MYCEQGAPPTCSVPPVFDLIDDADGSPPHLQCLDRALKALLQPLVAIINYKAPVPSEGRCGLRPGLLF